MTATTTTPRDPGKEMSLFEHLAELRYRLVVSILALFAGAAAAYGYAPHVFAILNAPYLTAFPNSPLIGTGPAEAFMLRIKVAFFSGALLVSPILFLQLWFFVAPGLYAHERRLLVPFVASATFLFLGGVAFCYELVLPLAYRFFSGEYHEVGIMPAIRISEHLSTIITALLGFGAVFELPMIAFFLGRMGIIDHNTLIRNARYAIVIIFIVAAIFTPPDVLSQFLMAGPLVLLYGASIMLLKWTAKPAIQETTVNTAQQLETKD
jgi:sec-independent protein translocase protein TatC